MAKPHSTVRTPSRALLALWNRGSLWGIPPGRYALCALVLILAILSFHPLYLRLMSGIHYLSAGNHLQEGYLGLAIEHLKKADSYNHGDYNTKKRLGEAYHRLGALRQRAIEAWPLVLKSRESYDMATILNPLDAEAFYGLARADARLEQLYEYLHPESKNSPYNALPSFRKAISLRPNSILFRYAMAQYLHRHNKDELLPVVRTLVRVYPPAYSHIKREPFWSPAVKEVVRQGLEQAIEEETSLRDAHKAVSSLLAEDKEWTGAISHYRQALNFRVFSNTAGDHIHLGNLFLKNGELDKAEEHFLKGLDRSRSRENDLERLYNIYKREKDPEGFSRFYSQVGKRFITTNRMDILLSRSLMDRKEYNQAREILIKVIKKDQTANAYYWLARIEEAEKDWDSMELAIQKATVLEPAESSYHMLFSSVLKRLNKLERAEKEAGLALKYGANPSPWSFNHRAGIRWSRKDYEGAAKDWQRAIRLKPDYASFHANAGEAYARQGHSSLALRYYKKALDLDPKNEHYKKRYLELKQN